MSSFIGLDKEPEKEKRKTAGVDALNALFKMDDTLNDIVELPIEELVPYRNHKFRPSSEAKRDMIRESIKEFGVLEPVIVRPREDIGYEIDGKYEILAGHQRTELSGQAGKKTVPAIIKKGLSEDEAEQIVAETNMQRSFEEMSYSERAAVLSSHYNATKRRNVRTEVLEEINSYLETYASPVNTRAEEGLSPGGTEGVRGVAEDYDLSKNTIARYIRVDTLIDRIKELLDDGKIPFKAAVELSYIKEEKQYMFETLINNNGYKCDINMAKLIRALEEQGKLTVATMTDVLMGRKVKKSPGKPKPFSINGNIMKKYEQYFTPEQKKKDIENIIDKALEMYFAQNE